MKTSNLKKDILHLLVFSFFSFVLSMSHSLANTNQIADFDKNGIIDEADFEIFSAYFYDNNLLADLNASGSLNYDDIALFMQSYKITRNSIGGEPLLPKTNINATEEPLTQETIEQIVNARDKSPLPPRIIPITPTEPAAYWPLNEGKGLLIKDSSEHGFDGVLGKKFSWKKTNLVFNGIDNHINVGAVDIKGKEITLTAWARIADIKNCSLRDCRIISKATGGEQQEHYWMLSTIQQGNKTRLRFLLKANGFTSELIASTGDLKNGEVFHVSAVYDGLIMRLYKNGIEVGNDTKIGRIDSSDSVDVWIGGNPGGGKPLFWNGSIADVRVYQTALTIEQIIEIKDDFK